MGVDLPELPGARRLEAGTEGRLRLAESIEDQALAGFEFEGEPVLLSGEGDGAFDGCRQRQGESEGYRRSGLVCDGPPLSQSAQCR